MRAAFDGLAHLSFGKLLHHRQLVRRRYDGIKAEVWKINKTLPVEQQT